MSTVTLYSSCSSTDLCDLSDSHPPIDAFADAVCLRSCRFSSIHDCRCDRIGTASARTVRRGPALGGLNLRIPHDKSHSQTAPRVGTAGRG
eukprot:4680974-Prymnesium_polylepis.1